MKANEAPEKLYLSKNIYSTFVYQTPDPDDETQVEYTCTDVFIEKACEFLFENYHGEKLSLRMINDFKNAMKGE